MQCGDVALESSFVVQESGRLRRAYFAMATAHDEQSLSAIAAKSAVASRAWLIRPRFSSTLLVHSSNLSSKLFAQFVNFVRPICRQIYSSNFFVQFVRPICSSNLSVQFVRPISSSIFSGVVQGLSFDAGVHSVGVQVWSAAPFARPAGWTCWISLCLAGFVLLSRDSRSVGS